MSPEERFQVRLLAIDLGLRCGWAAFDRSGRLLGYGSRHFGSRGSLRKAIPHILGQYPRLACLVIEGGGELLVPWERGAARRGVDVRQVASETWREAMLKPKERATGPDAKASAGAVARHLIERSGARRPTSLRHDAAEAIVLGAWAWGQSPPLV